MRADSACVNFEGVKDFTHRHSCSYWHTKFEVHILNTIDLANV